MMYLLLNEKETESIRRVFTEISGHVKQLKRTTKSRVKCSSLLEKREVKCYFWFIISLSPIRFAPVFMFVE